MLATVRYVQGRELICGSVEPFFSGLDGKTLKKHPLLPKKSIPSPAARQPLVEKFKKAFVFAALVGGSSWGLLAPTVASAGFFSISSLLSSITPQASAASESQNSQTLPLLAPATNIDPNPSVGGGDVAVVDGSALVPQDGPSGTSADIGARPVSYSISVYTVREGDTLSGIAHMFGVSMGTITGANSLQGKPIHPGQELVILPITGMRYTVKKGDTIAGIAKATKSDAFDIQQYNDLASDSDLAAGASILIPNVETVVATPAAAKNTAVKKAVAKSSGGLTEPLLGGGGASIPGYYARPLAGGVLTQGLHGYNGVDLGAPNGTPIYAAAAGTVIVAAAGGYNGGYGSYVVIKHPNGTQTLYGHMSRVLTTVGATVAQGDNIGLVGSTGKSTGNHLHFEVRGAANPFAN
jgi:LysM repeat protein